jgi:hypothetical protein
MRDNTSPVRVTSKNWGDRPSTLSNTAFADIGDHPLAQPGHGIKANRRRQSQHRRRHHEGSIETDREWASARSAPWHRSGPRANLGQHQGGRGGGDERQDGHQDPAPIGPEKRQIPLRGASDLALGRPAAMRAVSLVKLLSPLAKLGRLFVNPRLYIGVAGPSQRNYCRFSLTPPAFAGPRASYGHLPVFGASPHGRLFLRGRRPSRISPPSPPVRNGRPKKRFAS